MSDILTELRHDGARLDSDRCQKGSTWVFELQADGRIGGRYLPPAG